MFQGYVNSYAQCQNIVYESFDYIRTPQNWDKH